MSSNLGIESSIVLSPNRIISLRAATINFCRSGAIGSSLALSVMSI
jgi:hypothetical protein